MERPVVGKQNSRYSLSSAVRVFSMPERGRRVCLAGGEVFLCPEESGNHGFALGHSHSEVSFTGKGSLQRPSKHFESVEQCQGSQVSCGNGK